MTSCDFAHIWWIGGVTCSGKSTAAKCLAEKFNREIYNCDEHFDRHVRKALEDIHPTMYRFCHDKLWARSTRELPVVERAAVWLQFYRERFTLICGDLLQMGDTKVIADGVDLLPEMVEPIASEHHAAWLVPTREFFDQHYFTREWALGDESEGDYIWSYYQVLIEYHINASVKKFIEVSGERNPIDIADELSQYFTTQT